jgi:transcriptional regulator with XRE-family HTH domain
MTTARDYVPEKRHAKLTRGRSLQIVRELQEMTQSELARRSGIAQSAISAFESGAQEMGLRRVEALAAALGVHPAVIAFPNYGGASVTNIERGLHPAAPKAAKVAKKRTG